jgi:hypothetical protein
MKWSKVLAIVFVLVLGAARAAAQDTVQVAVKLPRGEVQRACTEWHSEAIFILTADSRDPGPDAEAYLRRLARAIGRRLGHISPDSAVLFASFGARIAKSGAVSDLRLLSSSGRQGFDMDARRAAQLKPGDEYVIPAPPAMPDSFTVLISFGRHEDGSDHLVKHRWCPAAPLPWNGTPVYPEANTIWRVPVSVHVNFTVDTANAIDPYSVALQDSASDIFAAATIRYVSSLGYLSAEFDGTRERQSLTKEVRFIPPDSVAARTP